MAVGVDYTAEGGVWDPFRCCWTWRDDKGQLHRPDGPAVISADGHQEWWLHGERHRMDGPAIIYSNGRQFWCVHHRDITEEVEAWMTRSGITWPFTREQLMEFQLRWL